MFKTVLKKFVSDESKLLQVSNCYYPSKSDDIEDFYGKNGINKLGKQSENVGVDTSTSH